MRTLVAISDFYPSIHRRLAFGCFGFADISHTPIEMEPYDLSRDPLQLINVAETPANAARVTHMAARLRALRPGWPFDACRNDIDSDE